MKKLVSICIAFFCFYLNGFSQTEALRNTISIGYGIPNLYKTAFSVASNNGADIAYKGVGPLHLKYERRIHDRYGLGLSINHVSYQFDWTDNYLDTQKGRIVPNDITLKGFNTAFNIRNNFHFLNQDNDRNMEFYFGLGLGFRIGKPKVSATYNDSKPNITLPSIFIIGAEITLGFRKYITENIGLYTEIGLAKSIVQFGICTRF